MLHDVRRFRAAVFCAALVLPLGAPAVFAQGTPAPAAAPPANPLFEAARAAFEALLPNERRAIQDDLSWTSTYVGSLDGAFGKGTFDALMAFELKNRLKADGVLDLAERRTLAAEADKLRKLVGFAMVADPRTGARLGLPVKALDASAPRGRGTAWTRRDNKLSVWTDRYGPDEADLGAMFEQLRAEQPGRKITYAVLRATFLVVAGETQTHKFYTRYATGPAGIVGFTYGYDKSTPDGDRFAVIIANAFEPFPAGDAVAAAPATPPPAVAAAPQPAAPPPGPPAARPPAPAPAPAAQVPAAPAAPPPERAASGLVVAPGRVLTVTAAVEACRGLTVAGKPAKVLRSDAESGLALVEAEVGAGTAAGPALRASAPAGGEALVVLGHAERAAAGGLMVGPGETVAATGARAGFRVLTPLQPGGLGGTVVDRSGAIAAFIAGSPREPRRIAGVLPETAWEVVGASAAAGFLNAAGIATTAAAPGPARTAGQIAAALKPAVVPLVCAR